MSASSSTSQSLAPILQEQPPLPLIRCPWCHNGDIEWWVSRTPKNPGKHFYKCERHWQKYATLAAGAVIACGGEKRAATAVRGAGARAARVGEQRQPVASASSKK
uniref:Uncharacterized protein n=1 Tax=Triticum aestivum TaxID=4565 RepID=A0A3B6PT98_WHEAT